MDNEILRKVAETIVRDQEISYLSISQKTGVGYNEAREAVEKLTKLGIVSERIAGTPQEVLVSDIHALDSLLPSPKPAVREKPDLSKPAVIVREVPVFIPEPKKKSRSGLTAGIIIGILVAVFVLAIVGYFIKEDSGSRACPKVLASKDDRSILRKRNEIPALEQTLYDLFKEDGLIQKTMGLNPGELNYGYSLLDPSFLKSKKRYFALEGLNAFATQSSTSDPDFYLEGHIAFTGGVKPKDMASYDASSRIYYYDIIITPANGQTLSDLRERMIYLFTQNLGFAKDAPYLDNIRHIDKYKDLGTTFKSPVYLRSQGAADYDLIFPGEDELRLTGNSSIKFEVIGHNYLN